MFKKHDFNLTNFLNYLDWVFWIRYAHFLYFFRKLRRAEAPVPIMRARIVSAAERIIGACLLPWQHLHHPSHLQSSLYCGWAPPPVSQLLQPSAIRRETAEYPSQHQQTQGQHYPPGCQEAQLPPYFAPPPLLLSTSSRPGVSKLFFTEGHIQKKLQTTRPHSVEVRYI